MDAFPSGDSCTTRGLGACRFTTIKCAFLTASTVTMVFGAAACSSPNDLNPGASSGVTARSAERTSASNSTDSSALVNADSVPGLSEVPTLRIAIEDSYAMLPPLLSTQEPAKPPFVQGLEFESDGSLLVGTGLYDQSQIYRLPQWLDNSETQATNINDLAPGLFGEGITRSGDSVWQLTWREGRAIERDAMTLEQRREVALDTEGWGACSLGDSIVTSDGTGTLTFRSTVDLSPQRRLKVTAAGKDTTWLNELECVAAGETNQRGEIWANVWQSPFIYRIDATSGEVTGIVDARELYWDVLSRIDTNQIAELDVLNGIALIPQDPNDAVDTSRQFLLTGKKWPFAYRVSVAE